MDRNLKAKRDSTVKVTVIVPVYNVEKYIDECLKSLVLQTLPELEIIVVNDGSTDKSQQIIDEYVEDYPDRIISIQKENGGQSAARNMALQMARGEYVGFVDSDDWVDPEMFEKMYEKAICAEADVVICNSIDHYQDHEVYHCQSDFSKMRKCGAVYNKIFKNEVIKDHRFPEGMWYEDLSFGMKILMMTEKVVNCTEHFYHARSREYSTMNNNDALKNLDILWVVEDLIKFAKQNGIYDKYCDDLEFMTLDHILVTSVNRVAKQQSQDKEIVIKKMREYVLNRYPHFRKDRAFQFFDKKKKIVAVFNGMGMHSVVQAIFKAKKIVIGRR